MRSDKIGGPETFSKPIIDWLQDCYSVTGVALLAQQAREAGHRTQLPGQRPLPARFVMRLQKKNLRRFHG